MRRCIELAALGEGRVAPNPMVGAVLVHEGRIIGEGYHKNYGGPHAEVNCIASVKEPDLELIGSSTMYVSLEPCAHHGKTPPCCDLLIRYRVPRVMVGCRDPFIQVDGKGIEKLRAAGVSISVGLLEEECKKLNRRFLTFHNNHRPYVILKWAQTHDKKIGTNEKRLYITGSITNRMVHKWRSEEAAILVGTNTALADDPMLTNRLWTGHSPIRIVIDRHLRLPPSLKIFDGSVKTMVINTIKQEMAGDVLYYRVQDEENLVRPVLDALYTVNINSVMVEGGAKWLQSFIDEGLWDEARIITHESMTAATGIPAPSIGGRETYREALGDEIVVFLEPSR